MKPPQKNQIYCGSNLDVIKSWPSNCIDAICTDPPYGLEFMGKDWDKGLPGIRFWREFLRITKPGGFLLCFGGTRTYHRLACAIEDAGWEIRDCMAWIFGSGFPKSHNISKALEKKGKNELAKLWEGMGTALKPAFEPILVCMKPLDGTFAHNAEAHGVAGLNIDGGRIGTDGRPKRETHALRENVQYQGSSLCGRVDGSLASSKAVGSTTQGRWPANLILDPEAGAMLDKQTQNVGSTKPHKVKSNKEKYEGYGSITHKSGEVVNYNEPNVKGASRFFYCAKTSRKERNMGMEDCEDKLLARSGGAQGAENRGEKEYLQKSIGLNRVAVVKNNHPTVKPLALMKYLCTLLKMPSADQIILDPFLGSGTTGMACKELGIDFIGIEKEREYCEIAVKRIAAVPGQEITLETTLPVTKNVETFRAAKDSVGGGRRPNESLPHVSESRQRIINAASAALRRNRK